MSALALVSPTPQPSGYLPSILTIPGFVSGVSDAATLAENEGIEFAREPFRVVTARGVHAQQQILVHLGTFLCGELNFDWDEVDGQGRFLADETLTGFKFRVICRRGDSTKSGFRISYREGRTGELLTENALQLNLFLPADVDGEDVHGDDEYINILLVCEVKDAYVDGVVQKDAQLRLHAAIPTKVSGNVLICSERELIYQGLVGIEGTDMEYPEIEAIEDGIDDLEEWDDFDDLQSASG